VLIVVGPTARHDGHRLCRHDRADNRADNQDELDELYELDELDELGVDGVSLQGSEIAELQRSHVT
jgi:hypothetical protein